MTELEPDLWADAAVIRISGALEDALALEKGVVSLFLAGGSTPEPVYRRLADTRGIAWERIGLWFGDERCVPPDHPDSNYRMARRTLLDALPTEPAGVHRMEAEREDRDEAAADYARSLPDAPSVILLGIGGDGHTASLFPGSAALDERERRVVPVTAPAEPACRMTITPPVLEAARRVFVLARGASKAEAVARAMEGELDPSACPAQLVRKRSWLLDAEAAALLEAPP